MHRIVYEGVQDRDEQFRYTGLEVEQCPDGIKILMDYIVDSFEEIT